VSDTRYLKTTTDYVFAVKWTGDNYHEVRQFIEKDAWFGEGMVVHQPTTCVITFPASAGFHHVNAGDWVVRGEPFGELSVMKPAVFDSSCEVAP
jgi:hypothetical protein